MTREKRTFVQQPRCKHFSKCSRMGAASNGTFSSNFSVTLIRQRALMAPLSSPGSSCRFNGLRPKFIGKDCAVPPPKKPGRKSERWDSGLANSVLDRSWIEMDGYYILDSTMYIYIYMWYCMVQFAIYIYTYTHKCAHVKFQASFFF